MPSAAIAREPRPLPSDKNARQGPRTFSYSRQAFCAFCLILADASAIIVSLRLAIFLRSSWVPLVDAHVTALKLPLRYYLNFGWLWFFFVLFLGIQGLYTQRRTMWNETGHLIKAVFSGLMLIFAAIALVQKGPVLSRLTILLTGLLLLVVLPLTRFWVKKALGAMGIWRKRILILGATDTASLAIRGLSSDPVLGYEVVGILDDDPGCLGKSFGTSGGKPILVLGDLADVPRQLAGTGARDVLIAMPYLDDEYLLALVHDLQPLCESIYVVPQLWGLPLMNLKVDGFLRERLMMLKLSNNLAKPWNNWMKRTFDLVLGFALSLLALPLCVVLAVLVKLDSDGPILFIQERLGHNGRSFRCFKFRSMHNDCEHLLSDHLASNPSAADEWHKYAKLRNHDPRLTRLGRFLRKWSLDELPQLLNVLKGEMSLVGPRPYLPEERGRIGVALFTILSSRPGITGFWQVNGRNRVTLAERVELEAWYVRNWTIWFDCIILAKTLKAVVFSHHEPGVIQDLEAGV